MMPQFEKSPYYLQIREKIFEKIVSGEYKAGDKLPSEDALASAYGVSRITVNKALSELLNQGLLTRSQGHGTFVSKLRKEGKSSDILGLFTSMERKGFRISSQVLEQKMITPPKSVAQEMKVPVSRELFYLKRLRRVNGLPIVLQSTYIALGIAGELLKEDFSTQSLYQTLRSKYDCIITRAVDRVEALIPDGEVCRMLELPAETPALSTRRLSSDQNGVLVECTSSIYRSDQYELEIEYHG